MNEEEVNPVVVWVGRVAILVTFFDLWEYASRNGILDPLLVGAPSGIASFLWDGLFVKGDIWYDLGWTLRATAIAFVIGGVSGVLVGMLFVVNPTIEKMMSPIVAALNAMPRAALAPLFLIWFGLGIGSKIALAVSLSFFMVLSATVAGGRGVSADHLTLARTLGASGSTTFLKFTLPNAVPVIFSGLRLGLVYSLLGVIFGELIAAEHGLGQTLTVLAAEFKTNGVFALIILLAMIGMILSSIMTMIENHLLRWR